MEERSTVVPSRGGRLSHLQCGVQAEEQISVAPANNTGPPLLQVWAEELQAVLHVEHNSAMQHEGRSNMQDNAREAR